MPRTTLPPFVRLTLSGWSARLVILASQLLSVRVLLGYLGTTQYAAFAVLNGAAGWFTLLDFGLGPSVEHAVAQARARGDRVEPVLRATIHLVVRILPLALILVGVTGPVLQYLLLRTFAPTIPTPPTLLLAGVGALVVVSTLGGAGYRVFFATQRAHRQHAYTALAAAASLGALVALRQLAHGCSLALALMVAAVPGAIFAVLAFAQALRGTIWSGERAVANIVSTLTARARRHLTLALLSATVLQVDYLVMSQTLAAREIVVYTLLARVFGVLLVFHGVLMGSSWSELTEAVTRRDRLAADDVVRRSLMGSLGLVGLGVTGLLLVADHAAAFFTADPSIRLPRSAIALFACALALRIWSDVHTYALLALGRFGALWWAIPAQATVNLIAQYSLSRAYGAHGVIAGLALSFLCVAWVGPLAYRKATCDFRAGPDRVDPREM